MLALLLMITPVQAGQNDPLEIITLQHRMAADVIPIIQPMLKADDSITGYNNQLILRTSKSRLSEIHSLLESLDRAPRNLLISVDNSSSASGQDRSIEGSTHLYSSSRTGADINVDVKGRSHRSNADGRYQLRVLEGHAAVIETGRDTPYQGYEVIEDRNGRIIRKHIDYREVRSGFYVVPQVIGQRVDLEIVPQQESLSDKADGSLKLQHIDTVVSGRLGEWINIGGIMAGQRQDSRGLLAQTQRRSDMQTTVRIKVEIID